MDRRNRKGIAVSFIVFAALLILAGVVFAVSNNYYSKNAADVYDVIEGPQNMSSSSNTVSKYLNDNVNGAIDSTFDFTSSTWQDLGYFGVSALNGNTLNKSATGDVNTGWGFGGQPQGFGIDPAAGLSTDWLVIYTKLRLSARMVDLRRKGMLNVKLSMVHRSATYGDFAGIAIGKSGLTDGSITNAATFSRNGKTITDLSLTDSSTARSGLDDPYPAWLIGVVWANSDGVETGTYRLTSDGTDADYDIYCLVPLNKTGTVAGTGYASVKIGIKSIRVQVSATSSDKTYNMSKLHAGITSTGNVVVNGNYADTDVKYSKNSTTASTAFPTSSARTAMTFQSWTDYYTLTAKAVTGYVFVGWLERSTQLSSYTITNSTYLSSGTIDATSRGLFTNNSSTDSFFTTASSDTTITLNADSSQGGTSARVCKPGYDYIAVYIPMIFSVSFSGNGSTSGSMAAFNLCYNSAVNLPSLGYEKTGSSFINWTATTTGAAISPNFYSDGRQMLNPHTSYPSGSNSSSFRLSATYNITLTAYWSNYTPSTSIGTNRILTWTALGSDQDGAYTSFKYTTNYTTTFKIGHVLRGAYAKFTSGDFNGQYVTIERDTDTITSSTVWTVPFCNGNYEIVEEWTYASYSTVYFQDYGYISGTSTKIVVDSIEMKDITASSTSSGWGTSSGGFITCYIVQGIGISAQNMPIPTKAGYLFLGWYTGITGGSAGTYYGSISPTNTSTVDLYIKWRAVANNAYIDTNTTNAQITNSYLTNTVNWSGVANGPAQGFDSTNATDEPNSGYIGFRRNTTGSCDANAYAFMQIPIGGVALQALENGYTVTVTVTATLRAGTCNNSWVSTAKNTCEAEFKVFNTTTTSWSTTGTTSSEYAYYYTTSSTWGSQTKTDATASVTLTGTGYSRYITIGLRVYMKTDATSATQQNFGGRIYNVYTRYSISGGSTTKYKATFAMGSDTHYGYYTATDIKFPGVYASYANASNQTGKHFIGWATAANATVPNYNIGDDIPTTSQTYYPVYSAIKYVMVTWDVYMGDTGEETNKVIRPPTIRTYSTAYQINTGTGLSNLNGTNHATDHVGYGFYALRNNSGASLTSSSHSVSNTSGHLAANGARALSVTVVWQMNMPTATSSASPAVFYGQTVTLSASLTNASSLPLGVATAVTWYKSGSTTAYGFFSSVGVLYDVDESGNYYSKVVVSDPSKINKNTNTPITRTINMTNNALVTIKPLTVNIVTAANDLVYNGQTQSNGFSLSLVTGQTNTPTSATEISAATVAFDNEYLGSGTTTWYGRTGWGLRINASNVTHTKVDGSSSSDTTLVNAGRYTIANVMLARSGAVANGNTNYQWLSASAANSQLLSTSQYVYILPAEAYVMFIPFTKGYGQAEPLSAEKQAVDVTPISNPAYPNWTVFVSGLLIRGGSQNEFSGNTQILTNALKREAGEAVGSYYCYFDLAELGTSSSSLYNNYAFSYAVMIGGSAYIYADVTAGRSGTTFTKSYSYSGVSGTDYQVGYPERGLNTYIIVRRALTFTYSNVYGTGGDYVYDASAKGISITVAGLSGSESVVFTSLDTDFSNSPTGAIGNNGSFSWTKINQGTYLINVSYLVSGGNNNYDVTIVNPITSFIITPRQLTVAFSPSTPNPYTYTYNGLSQGLSVTVSNIVSGDTTLKLSIGTLGLVDTSDVTGAVLLGAHPTFYLLTSAGFTSASVKFSAVNKGTYGVAGIEFAEGNDFSNYVFATSTRSMTFKIDPKQLTVTWTDNNASHIYNASSQGVSVTVSGTENGEIAYFNAIGTDGKFGQTGVNYSFGAVDCGVTYTIRLELTDNLANENYSLPSNASAAWSIVQKEIDVVRWEEISAVGTAILSGASFVYKADYYTVAAILNETSGIYASDLALFAFAYSGARQARDAGNYTVTVSLAGSLPSSNYRLKSASDGGKLTLSWSITPIEISISWQGADAISDGDLLKFIFDGTDKFIFATVGNLIGGDALPILYYAPTSGVSAPTNRNANDKNSPYVTEVVGISGTNYVLPSSGLSKGWYIARLEVNVAYSIASGTNLIYSSGLLGNTLTLSNLVSSAPLSVAVTVSSGFPQVNVLGGGYTQNGSVYTLTSNANTLSAAFLAVNIGTYGIVSIAIADCENADNYVLVNTVGCEWTIGKNKIYLTFTPELGLVYNGYSQVGLTLTVAGILNNDDVSIIAIGAEMNEINGAYEFSAKNFGTYTVTVVNLTGVHSENYEIVGVNSGAFSIAKKGLSIIDLLQGNGAAYNEEVFTYDGNVKSVKVGSVSGICASDEVLFNYSDNAKTNAGDYTVQIFLAETLPSSNYEIISGAVLPWKVNKKEVFLSVSSPAPSYEYDGYYHGVTVAVTGLIYGDAVVFGFVTVKSGAAFDGYTLQSIAVGSYQVIITGVTDANNDNYKLGGLVCDVAFEIYRREVTVNWGQTSFNYDGTLKVVTATVGRVVGSEAVVFELTDNEETDAGNYTARIIGLLGADANNYSLPANLTTPFSIARRNLTFSWTADPNAIFSGDEYGRTLTLDGLLDNQDVILTFSLSGTFESEGVKNGQSYFFGAILAGAYAMQIDTISAGIDTLLSNYAIPSNLYDAVQFTIAKKLLTGTWRKVEDGEEYDENQPFEYDGTVREVFLELSGLVANFDSGVTYSGTKSAVHFGQYTVQGSPTSDNYLLISTLVWNISAKVLTAAWSYTDTYDNAYIYNGLEQGVRVEISGMISGDLVSFAVAATNFSASNSFNSGAQTTVLRDFTAVNQGTYLVALSVLANADYTFEITVEKSWVIDPLTVEFSWGRSEFDYTGQQHDKGALVSAANKIGADVVTFVFEENELDKVVSAASLKGNYTVRVTGFLSNPNGNYRLPDGVSERQASWAVIARNISVNVSFGEGAFIYNGTAQGKTLTLSNVVLGDEITFTVKVYKGGVLVGTETLPYVGALSPAVFNGADFKTINAGSYVIELYSIGGLNGDNYVFNASDALSGGYTIEQRELTFTWEFITPDNSPYDGNAKGLTLTIGNIVENETLSFLHSVVGAGASVLWSGTIASFTAVNAGTYSGGITRVFDTNSVADNAGGNYALPSVGAANSFTVAKRVVTVSWQNERTFVYNGEVRTVIASVGNTVGSEVVTFAYTGNAERNAGEYIAEISGFLLNPNNNYALPALGLTTLWEINALTVELNFVGLGSFVYNGGFRYVEAYVANKISGDTVTVVLSGDDNAKNVGAYVVYAIGLSNNALENYVLNDFALRYWSITPKEIFAQFTYADGALTFLNRQIEVGADIPLSFIGACGDDVITYVLTFTSGGVSVAASAVFNAGSYAVTVELGAGEQNYTMTAETLSFRIYPRKIGLENLSFTYTTNGETVPYVWGTPIVYNTSTHAFSVSYVNDAIFNAVGAYVSIEYYFGLCTCRDAENFDHHLLDGGDNWLDIPPTNAGQYFMLLKIYGAGANFEFDESGDGYTFPNFFVTDGGETYLTYADGTYASVRPLPQGFYVLTFSVSRAVGGFASGQATNVETTYNALGQSQARPTLAGNNSEADVLVVINGGAPIEYAAYKAVGITNAGVYTLDFIVLDAEDPDVMNDCNYVEGTLSSIRIIFTVLAKRVDISVTALEKAYDNSPSFLGFSVGSVSASLQSFDDGLLILGTNATVVAAFASADAGADFDNLITFILEGTDANNYELNIGEIFGRINAKEITVAWANNFSYDADSHTMTASPLAGEVYNGDNFTLAYLGNVTEVNAGDYEISCTSLNLNYVVTNNVHEWSIARAEITVTYAANFTYDAESHAMTASANAVFGSDVVTFSYAGDTEKINAGDYEISCTSLNSNYVVTNSVHAWSILKAAVTIEFSNLSHTYDATLKTVTATVIGLKKTDVSDVIFAGGDYTASQIRAGRYTARVTGVTNANYYLEFYADAEWEIEKADMNADSIRLYLHNLSVTYDTNYYATGVTKNAQTASSILSLSVSLFGTDVASVSYLYTTDEMLGVWEAFTSNVAKDAKIYYIKAIITAGTDYYGDGLESPIVTLLAEIEIEKARVSNLSLVGVGSFVYNGSERTVTLNNTVTQFNETIIARYFVNGIEVTEIAAKNVGTYNVRVEISASANYVEDAPITGTLSITPAYIGSANETLSISGGTYEYDGELKFVGSAFTIIDGATSILPLLTLGGIIAGEIPELALVTIVCYINGSINYVPFNGAVNVGTYRIAATITCANYYDLVLPEAVITITPKTVTVVWSHSVSYTYNGFEQNATVSAVISNLCNADKINETGVMPLVFTNSNNVIATFKNADTYAVTLGYSSDNYTVLNAEITLTIEKTNINAYFVGTERGYDAMLHFVGVNSINAYLDGNVTSVSAPVLFAQDVSSVSYTIDGVLFNGAKNAGVYDVTCYIDAGENYYPFEKTVRLKINAVEIAGLEFIGGGTFVYTGEFFVVELNKTVTQFNEDVTVVYLVNGTEKSIAGERNVGNYRVTAQVIAYGENAQNYIADELFTDLIITKADMLSADGGGFFFGDGTLVYNGQVYGLGVVTQAQGSYESLFESVLTSLSIAAIAGGSVDVAQITYHFYTSGGEYLSSFNGASNAGIYYIRATLSNANYNDIVLYGILEITVLEVQVVWVTSASYTYNGYLQEGTLSCYIELPLGGTMNLTFTVKKDGVISDFKNAGTYVLVPQNSNPNFLLIGGVDGHGSKEISIAKFDLANSRFLVGNTVGYDANIHLIGVTNSQSSPNTTSLNPIALLGSDIVTVVYEYVVDGIYRAFYGVVNAGEYVVRARIFDLENYENWEATATLIITKASLVFTPTDKNPNWVKIYDGDTSVGYTVSGFVGSDEDFVTVSLAYDNKNAGYGKRLVITLELNAGAEDIRENYSLPEIMGEITKRTLVPITPNGGWTKNYDGNDLFGVITNFALPSVVVGGDILTVTARFNSKNVLQANSVTFILTGADADNYAIADIVTNVQIFAINSTVLWSGMDITYNGTVRNSELTAVFTLAESDANFYGTANYYLPLTLTFSRTEFGTFEPVTDYRNAGFYHVVGAFPTELIGNYVFTEDFTKTARIQKAASVLEWDGIRLYVYTNTDYSPLVSALFIPLGTDPSVTVTLTFNGGSIMKNAGTYRVLAALDASGILDNYTVTDLERTVSVDRAQITDYIDFSGADIRFTYDGVRRYYFASASGYSLTYVPIYYQYDDILLPIVYGGGTLSFELTVGNNGVVNAGVYTVTAVVSVTDNYYGFEGGIKITIDKAYVTNVFFAGATVEYKGAPYGLYVNNTENSARFDVTAVYYSDNSVASVIYKFNTVGIDFAGTWTDFDANIDYRNVNTYYVRAEILETQNYFAYSQVVTFTITPIDREVVWRFDGNALNSVMITYNAEDQTALLSAVILGVGSDGTVTFTTVINLTTLGGVVSGYEYLRSRLFLAGDYEITVSIPSLIAQNYNVSGASVTVSIRKFAAALQWSSYGGDVYDKTLHGVSALAVGVNNVNIPLNLSGTFSAVNAGNYTAQINGISQGIGDGLGSYFAFNYELSTTNRVKDWVILRRLVTLEVDVNGEGAFFTKEYDGTVNFGFSSTVWDRTVNEFINGLDIVTVYKHTNLIPSGVVAWSIGNIIAGDYDEIFQAFIVRDIFANQANVRAFYVNLDFGVFEHDNYYFNTDSVSERIYKQIVDETMNIITPKKINVALDDGGSVMYNGKTMFVDYQESVTDITSAEGARFIVSVTDMNGNSVGLISGNRFVGAIGLVKSQSDTAATAKTYTDAGLYLIKIFSPITTQDKSEVLPTSNYEVIYSWTGTETFTIAKRKIDFIYTNTLQSKQNTGTLQAVSISGVRAPVDLSDLTLEEFRNLLITDGIYDNNGIAIPSIIATDNGWISLIATIESYTRFDGDTRPDMIRAYFNTSNTRILNNYEFAQPVLQIVYNLILDYENYVFAVKDASDVLHLKTDIEGMNFAREYFKIGVAPTFIQQNDIDMVVSGEKTPVLPTAYFDGLYDGQNFAIIGMIILQEGANGNVGLFADLRGTVLNLKLLDTTVIASRGISVNMGAVAGYAEDAVISNVTVQGYFYFNGISVSVGAIVGYAKNSVLSNVTAVTFMSINAKENAYVGTIVGTFTVDEEAEGAIENEAAFSETVIDGEGSYIGDFTSARVFNIVQTYVIRQSYFGTNVSGQNGTSANPILIGSFRHMELIRLYGFLNFKLIADIKYPYAYGFVPERTAYYAGGLDKNGYKIYDKEGAEIWK